MMLFAQRLRVVNRVDEVGRFLELAPVEIGMSLANLIPIDAVGIRPFDKAVVNFDLLCRATDEAAQAANLFVPMLLRRAENRRLRSLNVIGVEEVQRNRFVDFVFAFGDVVIDGHFSGESFWAQRHPFRRLGDDTTFRQKLQNP